MTGVIVALSLSLKSFKIIKLLVILSITHSFSSAFITCMFVFQISVILSNPGECDSAVLHALTEALSISAIHPVEHPLLPGESVAEALHVHAEVPPCDRGPPRLYLRALHHVRPRVQAIVYRTRLLDVDITVLRDGVQLAVCHDLANGRLLDPSLHTLPVLVRRKRFLLIDFSDIEPS
jgi:hypothetical protein